MFSRNLLVKLPVMGLLAFAAACGGEKKAPEAAAPAGETSAPAAAPAGEAAAPAAQGQVHEVKMVTTQGGASGVFEPAELTVKKGDRIHFVTDGGAQHNVSFPAAENPAGAALPPVGPYLTSPGQTYDMDVTMDPGTYTFQCDPHAAMGMKGKLIVQ